jgi:hypothetical protein
MPDETMNLTPDDEIAESSGTLTQEAADALLREDKEADV